MVTLSTYYLKKMCLVCKYMDCLLAVKSVIPTLCISGIVTAFPSTSLYIHSFIHYTTSEQSVSRGMLICDTLILVWICVLASVLNSLPSLLSGVYLHVFLTLNMQCDTIQTLNVVQNRALNKDSEARWRTPAKQ